MMRPKQWVKNVFVIAPVIFASPDIVIDSDIIYHTLLATVCFSLLSSGFYIFNDIKDIDEDRHHPTKQYRPLAANKVSLLMAFIMALSLLIISFTISYFYLPIISLLVLSTYAIMQIVYNFYLKSYAIIDIALISLGFVLRLLMGAIAISITLSPWILITVFSLASLLGFSKRYYEFHLEHYRNIRQSLQQYNNDLLKALLILSTSSCLMGYILFLAERTKNLNHDYLYISGIFVFYGLCHYLYLVLVKKQGGEPEHIILYDRPIQICCFLWVISLIALWI